MRAFLLLLAPAIMAAQLSTRLSPETERAFDAYVKAAEAKMSWRGSIGKPGEVRITGWEGKSPIGVTDGMIHDWVGATTLPGVTAEKVIAVLQDYENYKKVYPPEVIDSRLISRDGNKFRAFLRLKKKKVLTAVLNSEYDVEYRQLDGGRWAVISKSTKMAEIDKFGERGERELPAGEGHGFLWRLNAYWLLEPRSEGLYVECRSISLSRDVPTGLGWIVKPMVSGLPKESLRTTLEATGRTAR